MPALFRGITSNHKEDFYCLNCFHSYTTKYKLKNHYNVYKNHDYCFVEIPKEDNEILKHYHGVKPMKCPFIIYADLEWLFAKMSSCINPEFLIHNNPKKWSTTKINENTSSGYSLFMHCSFDATKNQLYCYRDKDCMKMFCLDLRKHAARIINYEKGIDTINKWRK